MENKKKLIIPLSGMISSNFTYKNYFAYSTARVSRMTVTLI